MTRYSSEGRCYDYKLEPETFYGNSRKKYRKTNRGNNRKTYCKNNRKINHKVNRKNIRKTNVKSRNNIKMKTRNIKRRHRSLLGENLGYLIAVLILAICLRGGVAVLNGEVSSIDLPWEQHAEVSTEKAVLPGQVSVVLNELSL